MLILYCEDTLRADSYREMLPTCQVFQKKADFLNALPDARVAIVDEDWDFYENAMAFDYPQAFLFLAHEVPAGKECPHFLKKPFSHRALTNRAELLLTVVKKGLSLNFETTDYVFDGANRMLKSQKNGENIRLTQKEADLIFYLYENKDRLVPKDELLDEIFGYKEGSETHTLETHIYKLRQKTSRVGNDIIVTSDGGYTLKL